MAAALECWSGRPSTDEEMVEHVLMKSHHRSDAFSASSAAAAAAASAASSPSPSEDQNPSGGGGGGGGTFPTPPKKWQRLGRNFAGAIAALKSSLNIDSPRDPSPRSEKHFWGGAVRCLAQLYPNTHQPSEKLIANLRRHFDSLPNSYAQAGFDMKDVLLHARLIEQAFAEDQPAINILEMQENNNGVDGFFFKLTFTCNSPLSWQAMSGSLDSSLICCRKIQIFEKKGLTLGIVVIFVQSGNERNFKSRVEAALRSAVKKPKTNGVKLPFGLCGCQEENSRNCEEDSPFDRDDRASAADNEPLRRIQLPSPLPESSLVVSVDEWQTVRSGGEEIGRWIINSDEVEFIDWVGSNSFKGVYRGKKVWVKKLRGCEMGTAYDIEIRQDLLQLMSCGQKNILQFYGMCFEENHGLCIVTRMVEGGSVHDVTEKNRKLHIREVMRIALDVAEGLMFMNDHGVAYRDLNTQRILLDKQGNAYLGDMGIVTSCNLGEVKEYETAGYRWLAPEIIAGDPESATETWMSNIYSFGMVLWEMVTGEAAYSSYSPVQAAVGIAACGLRPEIPKDCPQVLKSLMLKCWNNCPSKRPQFSEIINILLRQNIR
ncbi:fibroblast growth factor receptor 3 [Ananas comosus]|uniref:Fibroblast growth factor receptor 3 n=2 Tax=Ananas comosus TaxID=4615 RepID=A0A6P5GJL6_ANACO|nr:fibroblast growth factor receptor 3 [Ananas comosus]